jgi:5-(carboxyamino)imidazole ribonucleotide synthase
VNRIALPGATIGVLGSGQLGRMMALEARRMGYRVHTLSPGVDTPTGQVADLEVSAEYEDLDAIRAFAHGVDVVTFEFENVATDAADAAAEIVPVRPSGAALHVTQQRAREKGFLADRGFPVTPFAQAASLDELAVALGTVGLPAIVKTAAFGYDGKGQHRIDAIEEADRVWGYIGHQQAIVERVVEFTHEISVIGARGLDGEFAHFGAIENIHKQHILDLSICPARIPAPVAQEAVQLTHRVMDELGYVGVLCVEFFVGAGGTLLVNEIAQLRPPDDRCARVVAVRATRARDLRIVARRCDPDSSGGDGQPAWRLVDGRRARLGGGDGHPGREAASVRQRRSAARPQDGSHHGVGGDGG